MIIITNFNVSKQLEQTKLENLSEELRVLYVAMTRAKDMLIMSCCGERLRGKLRELSTELTPETARLLAADASCPGDWILQTALLRTEAGNSMLWPESRRDAAFPNCHGALLGRSSSLRMLHRRRRKRRFRSQTLFPWRHCCRAWIIAIPI